MTRILFTGANGFLVRNILPHLSNYSISTLSQGGKHSYLCNLATEEPNFNSPFDVVFHAAGKAHMVPGSDSEKQAFFDVNVQGTKNLCKALEKIGVPKQFIFISTVAVYGVDSGVDITEEHPLSGVTPYAMSKIEAENFLIAWCRQHHVQLVILRPGLISGENAPGNLGAMARGIKSFKYASIGGGKACKSIVMAEDFATLIPLLEKIDFGIYNVCSDYAPTFKEIEDVIAKYYKRPIISIPLWAIKPMAKVGDMFGPGFIFNSLKLNKITSSLTFSNEKIKADTGWKPTDVISNLKF
ncbi:MAG: NAD-dependent epimerase/dehydratase family protein [Marinifilaceae bacterium]